MGVEQRVSEKRLQEIKDSIEFQVLYTEKHNFDKTLLQEEVDLYNEVIKLNNIIKEFDKWLENINIGELDDFFIGVKLSELKKAWNDIKGVDKE